MKNRSKSFQQAQHNSLIYQSSQDYVCTKNCEIWGMFTYIPGVTEPGSTTNPPHWEKMEFGVGSRIAINAQNDRYCGGYWRGDEACKLLVRKDILEECFEAIITSKIKLAKRCK